MMDMVVKEACIRDFAEYIGMQLKLARTQRKLTLRDVADMTGITPAAISKLERGESDMKLSTLAVLRSVLALDITVKTL